MDPAGRVVVVTGGANGIGRALVQRFLAVGAAAVVAADTDADGLSRLEHDDRLVTRRIDVSDRNQVFDLVGEVEQDVGPIDLFCSNAGIAAGGGIEVDPLQWQRSWDVNVMAHVHAASALIPRMIERGGGYLLQTASAAGLLTNLGAAPYSVTKHGAVAFAEWVAITYGDRGIGVSCLCPQFVSTELMDRLLPEARTAAWATASAITPQAVAEAALEGLGAETFLILPHPEVAEYFRRKAGDYDRWLAGMRRLQRDVFEHPPG